MQTVAQRKLEQRAWNINSTFKQRATADGGAARYRHVAASYSGLVVERLYREDQHALSWLIISFPVAEDTSLLKASMLLSTAVGYKCSESVFLLLRLDFENFCAGGKSFETQSMSEPSSNETTASQVARSSGPVAARECMGWVCI